ncbi:SGNH/GDSL hydrolase family protein [Couchioplanes caeruleus]|uniref:Lysophospholipase L1-like esterase n=1 Tax=Couchioplanes caeruleus TaxID=56438 RepID=A0A3N1GC22_9ACTN|nr:SGNH/GDSL hydrolase family protein [Couchioplanes caeruleus]ROP27770.1 lysophospholipase L1-like esterase [Couchioplanes caeruleus]
MQRRRLALGAAALLLPPALMVTLGREPAPGLPSPPAARAGTPPPATPPRVPVRVMALGDSITGSPGCWRALLWRRLPGVDFVGTRSARRCGFAHDGRNEGHSGFLATDVAARELLPDWLSATHPDVVMMHLGTNDVWRNRPVAAILTAFTTLVAQMRASNPRMRILVAQILPMDPAGCGACGRRVAALNAAVPGWAASLATAGSPITVVDQWSGFDTATDTPDGVHPNRAGDRKIAVRWYPALLAAVSRPPARPARTSRPGPPSG